MQSLDDAGVGNDSVRTQLISNSNTDTFYSLQPGERHIIYFSVRFEEQTLLPGDGMSQNSQIMQIKNTGTGPEGTRRMIIGMQEAMSQIHLTRALDRSTQVLMRHSGFARGEWLRFALDVQFSPDPGVGQIQLWGELTGDPSAQLKPMTDAIAIQTAYDSEAIGKLSIGPYHGMEIGAVSRDYANIQVTEWVAP